MKYAIIVAGGTGGHINAALAIGEAFQEKNFEVLYLTGKRPLDFKLFAHQNVIHLDSRPLRTNNPLTLVKNIIANLKSFIFIFKIYLKRKPSFVVGAGGYVCGPTLLAAFCQFIPVFIIEQNAVMGLTNRILGWISTTIFVHFSKTRGLPVALRKKVKVVGNPTRKSIKPVAAKKFDGKLKVLVFGGSLGAKQINDIIFEIIKNPPIDGMEIHHQLGSDFNPPEVHPAVTYVPLEYIDNMQAEYDWCDVIISRAGASTVSELAIIKKPAIIIPYPQATDDHQYYNAQIFQQEADFSVEVLNPRLEPYLLLKAVEDFLVKGSKENLKYSQTPHPGNDTCREILKEIRNHVGMA
jgi:UDP-N-acetylglucosamine--N-acetylmuramyl-(pentapeptide) pyrophosphoryl-undecaprenol N-acetylglucosamine transferase